MKILWYTAFFFMMAFTASALNCPTCDYKNDSSDRYCLDCGSEMKPLSVQDKKRLDQENLTREKERKKSNAPHKILKIVKDAETVDLEKFAIPGAVTLFDFTAEWCGPCKALKPEIEQFVNATDNVYLRIIDIKQWGSPVVRQHNIQGIPAIWIYDKHKKLKTKIVGPKMAEIRKTVHSLL